MSGLVMPLGGRHILLRTYKYKIGAIDTAIVEYPMVLRLAEQFLIRAEARMHLANISGAKNDLNVLRTRAGLGETLANDESSLAAAILEERRNELFTEWGNRWFDLKRIKLINSIMATVTLQKGGVWEDPDQLYPIPTDELKKMPYMSQNPGYQ